MDCFRRIDCITSVIKVFYKVNGEFDFSFGGNRRQWDIRDYHPDSLHCGSVSPTPVSYETPITTIYHQHHKPACGSHMLAGIINTLFGVVSSPKMAWDEIKFIDTIPPEDGTDLTAIAKVASNVGVCDLSLCPNTSEDNVSLTDYTKVSNITNEMVLNALPRKVSHYAFIDNPTFQQIKDNIYKFKVVALLVGCGDGWYRDRMNKPSYAEKDVCPLRLGHYQSGHFVYAYGFDENFVYFVNSWGTSWGRNGIGYFDDTYIPNVLEMGTFSIGSKFIFTQDLMYGLQTADVRELQILLGVTPVTGFFGQKTFSAVRQFQKAHGITSTGFWGIRSRTVANAL